MISSLVLSTFDGFEVALELDRCTRNDSPHTSIMVSDLLFEVCVDTAASAIAAREGGADRIELCANLLEGGTTPSAGSVGWVRERLDVGVMVLVRPRGGDFVYSEGETEVMLRDIEVMRQIGVQGVVLGALSTDGHIDRETTKTLVDAARPLSVTFHRAFDMCVDPHFALEQLVELGVDRVLTSGQVDSAADGVEMLRDLVQRAGNRIGVMPGGGILEDNIRDVVEATGCREVHFAAGATLASPMDWRNPQCTMGYGTIPGEYDRCVTDSSRVREFIRRASA